MNIFRTYFLPLSIIMFALMLSSCGNDDKGEPESPLDKAVKVQDALYNELQHAIVGHWIGAEHFNRGTTNLRDRGWEDISYISWDQEYVFNADGTGSDITAVNRHDMEWRLEKNPEFIHKDWEARQAPAVYVVFTYTNSGFSPTKRAIWLDGDNHEFMRLCDAPLGYVPSLLDSGPFGEFGIRYKKR